MTDICSIWSYQEILDDGYLGKKQARVLSIFTESYPKPLTATDVVKLIGRGVSENTRNRITELEQMGFLDKFDIIQCPNTRKKVNRWIFSGRKNPRVKRIVCIDCPRCKGAGEIDIRIYVKEESQMEIFK